MTCLGQRSGMSPERVPIARLTAARRLACRDDPPHALERYSRCVVRDLDVRHFLDAPVRKAAANVIVGEETNVLAGLLKDVIRFQLQLHRPPKRAKLAISVRVDMQQNRSTRFTSASSRRVTSSLNMCAATLDITASYCLSPNGNRSVMSTTWKSIPQPANRSSARLIASDE